MSHSYTNALLARGQMVPRLSLSHTWTKWSLLVWRDSGIQALGAPSHKQTMDNDDDATPNGGVGGRCGSRGGASCSSNGCVSVPSRGGGGGGVGGGGHHSSLNINSGSSDNQSCSPRRGANGGVGGRCGSCGDVSCLSNCCVSVPSQGGGGGGGVGGGGHHSSLNINSGSGNNLSRSPHRGGSRDHNSRRDDQCDQHRDNGVSVSGGWGGGVRCGSNNRDRDRGSDHNNNNHRSRSRSRSPPTCSSRGDGGGSSSCQHERSCSRSYDRHGSGRGGSERWSRHSLTPDRSRSRSRDCSRSRDWSRVSVGCSVLLLFITT